MEASPERGPASDDLLPRGGELRELAPYVAPDRRTLILAFAALALGSAALVAIPLVVRSAIDDALRAGAERNPGLRSALTVSALGAAQYGLSCAGRYLAARAALDVATRLRTALFAGLAGLDGAGLDALDTGQAVVRSNDDISVLQGYVNAVPSVAASALLGCGALTMLCVLAPALLPIAVGMPVVLWGLARRSAHRTVPVTRAALHEAGELASVAEEAVRGVAVVVGYAQQEREVRRFSLRSERLREAQTHAARISARFDNLLRAVPEAGQAAVLLVAGLLVLDGRIPLGTMVACCAYLAVLMGPATDLTAFVGMRQRARPSAERVVALAAMPSEYSPPYVCAAADPAVPSRRASPSSVEFDGVCFTYPGTQRSVLDRFSLRVEPGQVIALIGPTGAGKSTAAALLGGFYRPDAGTIRIGGVDLRALGTAALRQRLALCFQEPIVFSGRIDENIRYGRPDADDAAVREAARIADAHDFIEALPGGYAHQLGEAGRSLSGGQRQRIALARALIQDTDVLVLDDPVSAVDAASGQRILEALFRERALRRRTVLLITSRRNWLGLADVVIELDEGSSVRAHTESAPDVDAAALQVRPAMPNTFGLATTLDAARDTPGRHEYPPCDRTPQDGAVRDALHRDPPSEHAAVGSARFRFPLRVPGRAAAAVLLLTAAGTVARLMLPMLAQAAVDDGVEARSRVALFGICAVSGGLAAADALAGWAAARAAAAAGYRMLGSLRIAAFAQVLRLGPAYRDRTPTGRTMTLLTADVDALSAFLLGGAAVLPVGALTLAGALGALGCVAPRLLPALLWVVPAVVGALAWFRCRGLPPYRQARDRLGTVNAAFQEAVATLRLTQACGREAAAQATYAEAARAYRDARLKAHVRLTAFFQLDQFIGTLAEACVLFVGVRQLHAGKLSAGGLLASFLLLSLVLAPLQQLSEAFDSYRQAATGLGRLRSLLRTAPLLPTAPHPRPTGRLTGELHLRNVRFTYPGAMRPAVDDVDLVVPAGQTLALVGGSGAGKSTLVSLIARFRDPDAGAVLVDGMDLRDLDPTEYRRQLGLVPQEGFLFAGTVRDAVRYGCPDADDVAVERAARAVGAHAVITSLPGGYEQQVGRGGAGLSAGQRQLVALARARLTRPSIILLDEATSALDDATARGAGRLMAQPTTILVAHRLATAAAADRIAVMDLGRIVELGDHEGLLAAGGRYSALWAADCGGKQTAQDP